MQRSTAPIVSHPHERREQAIGLIAHTATFIRDHGMVTDAELAEILLSGFAELAQGSLGAVDAEAVAGLAYSLIASGKVHS